MIIGVAQPQDMAEFVEGHPLEVIDLYSPGFPQCA